MRMYSSAALAAAALCGTFAASGAVLIIDPFSVGQGPVQVIGTPSGPRTASGALDTNSVIGGEREILVERTSLSPNAGQTSVDVNLSIGDAATYASGPGTRGRATFTYDGDDAVNAFSPTGLGGIDFSVLGLTQFRVRATSDSGGLGIVEVYSAAGQFSRASFTLPADPIDFNFTDFVIPFAEFAAMAGGGANFSNVGAIRFILDGTSAAGTDIGVEFIRAESPIPEPSAVLLFGSGLAAVAIRRRCRR